ncbi:orotidine-5'-phosphate decarboxylase [Carboxydochorda subterranea]|uniref:Orotidine-5'-phosphate decarboxylase n=1 Tax=Carboxydichorda subterranea TaxID=3109565 RepID=A0ABZ1BZW3_9FIRM|nr:orotidine-5'-phosphate decarboxylase [Limnochorda sp. L945t]WRP18385.1 orotidine-5'-phosphate decarboxylase [Limnochorda sp. L945t]
MAEQPHFGERLVRAVTARGSCVVLGFDPDPIFFPPSILSRHAEQSLLERAASATEEVGAALVEACAPFVVAVKFQLAYFLALGPAGLATLQRLIRLAGGMGLLTIVDGKPGDIDATAAAYARALIGRFQWPGDGSTEVLGADACTVNPYLGTDSVRPFLEWVDTSGKGLFVLAHTSNPSAGEVQHLPLAGGKTVAGAVAGLIGRWAAGRFGPSGFASVGAVVGATYPEVVGEMRRELPGIWLLLPGVGAQGGQVEALGPAFDRRGLGGLVAASRSILGAWRTHPGGELRWEEAGAEAARRLRDQVNDVRGGA